MHLRRETEIATLGQKISMTIPKAQRFVQCMEAAEEHEKVTMKKQQFFVTYPDRSWLGYRCS